MEKVLELIIIHLIGPKRCFCWVYQQKHRSYLLKLSEVWNYFINRYLRSLLCFDFRFLRSNFFFRWLFLLFFWLIFIFLRTHGINDFFINNLYHIVINFLNSIFNLIDLLFHVIINIFDFLCHIIIDFLYVVLLNIITNVFLHLFVTFNRNFFIHWLLLVTFLSHNKVFLLTFRTFSWWFHILFCLLYYFSNSWCLSHILINKSASSISLEVYLGCDTILRWAYWVEPNWLLKLIQCNINKLLRLFNILC